MALRNFFLPRNNPHSLEAKIKCGYKPTVLEFVAWLKENVHYNSETGEIYAHHGKSRLPLFTNDCICLNILGRRVPVDIIAHLFLHSTLPEKSMYGVVTPDRLVAPLVFDGAYRHGLKWLADGIPQRSFDSPRLTRHDPDTSSPCYSPYGTRKYPRMLGVTSISGVHHVHIYVDTIRRKVGQYSDFHEAVRAYDAAVIAVLSDRHIRNYPLETPDPELVSKIRRKLTLMDKTRWIRPITLPYVPPGMSDAILGPEKREARA
jgi:hypothetical protein